MPNEKTTCMFPGNCIVDRGLSEIDRAQVVATTCICDLQGCLPVMSSAEECITFGRRLRAAGVPLETRKVLLGHRDEDITTHYYSAFELQELIDAAERICEQPAHKTPTLVVLKRKTG